MKDIQLETRTCTCGGTFKCLHSSKQTACSRLCRDNPNFRRVTGEEYNYASLAQEKVKQDREDKKVKAREDKKLASQTVDLEAGEFERIEDDTIDPALQ